MISIPEKAYAQEVEKLCEQLEVDAGQGLTDQSARRRLEEYGPNRLKKQKSKSLLRIFLEQFLNPIIYVLIAATVLAFAFGENIEGIAVVVVILITALIGFFMEWKANRSMEALRKMAQTVATVLRNGRAGEVKAPEIVPGDILLLEAGDVVPADARILEHEKLAVKEAALTGESTQVEKTTEALAENTSLADRTNMIFKGTLITRGTAKAVVTGAGEATELGKIHRMAKEAGKAKTPLEKKLTRLSKRLIWLTLVLAAIIAVAGYFQGKELVLMIETAIALAVAAIPEGLPVVATIALARGMLRLARRNVVIKKLEAVQTLGETGLICTDKTGTLTENNMAADVIALLDEEIVLSKESDPPAPDQRLDRLLKVGVLCNNVSATAGEEGEMSGDPVEVALVKLAQRFDYRVEEVRKEYPEALEIPFDTETKMMATVNEVEKGYWVCVKGALESLIDHCDYVMTAGEDRRPLRDKEQWKEKADELAGHGLRTLAFAFRHSGEKPAEDHIYESLTLLGLIGFIDPPRTDVRDAMAVCHQAGIKVVMVTGDHLKTARKIAVETGLMEEDAPEEQVVHGQNLIAFQEMSEEQQEKLLKAVVFARVTPAQKLDLVSLYQHHNFVVGMTGDGVNDAPALKKADISIAMGVRGTEAAKEVADIILGDDKFTSIELAIRQGRIIFNNIRKFVVYLLSSNLAEIISVALASLSNLPLPLLPLQILYLNLVTDVFPALALGMGEGERDIMQEPPRDPKEPIISRKLWISTIVYGLGITAGVLGITIFGHHYLALPDQQVNNMAFYTLVLAQLLNVFNLPKRHQSFFRNEVTRNWWVWGAIVLCILLTALGYMVPPLRQVLSLVPLDGVQLAWVGAFAVGSLLLTQLVKRLGGTV
jgi:Ca2+-transporting ATPase